MRERSPFKVRIGSLLSSELNRVASGSELELANRRPANLKSQGKAKACGIFQLSFMNEK